MANATSTQLQELYVAYFGRAADPTGLDYWKEVGITTAAFAANMYAQPEFKSAYGSMTTESQVNQIYKNLFDRAADVTGLTYWTQQIKLGNLQLAEIANHLIWAAQNNSGSADDKKALSNRTEAAVAYTAKIKETTEGILAYQPLHNGLGTEDFSAGVNITEAVNYLSGIDKDTASTAAGIATSVAKITDAGVPSPNAKTYTLTSNTDNLTGSTGKDVYQGVYDAAGSGTGTTATSGDSMVGGTGEDTFNLSITGDPAASKTISGINADVEKILISNYDSGDQTNEDHTYDASLSDGLTTVGLSSSNDIGDTIFSNIKGIVNAEMSSGSGDLTVTHVDSAVTGTADSMTITFSGQTAGTFSETSASAGGIETLNVVSKGSANTVDITSGRNIATTVNVSGNQNLTTTVASTALTTVDASALTGKLNLTYASAGDLTFTGGSGDDTFTFSADNFTSADTVNGGAGNDVLEIAGAITAATDLKNVSNVETLKLTGTKNVTLAADANVMNFDFSDNVVNVLTLNSGVSSAVTVDLGGSTSANQVVNSANVGLTVKGSHTAIDASTLITGGTGTDTIELTGDDDGEATTIDIAAGNITLVEKILVIDHGDSTTGTDSTTNPLSGRDIHLTTGAYATALTVDASALDAANKDSDSDGDIDSSDASEEKLTFVGTSATGVLTVTGGAGADTITSGTKNDVIDGGAGADTITSTGGNDNIKGGAGDDTIIFTTTLTKDDVVDGGDGTDTLSVTALDATALVGVTNVETLAFSGSATVTSDLSFDTIDVSASGGSSVTFSTGYTKATTVKVGIGDSVINAAKLNLTVSGNATDFETADSTIVTGSSTTTNDSLSITADGSTVATSGLITNVDSLTVVDGGDSTTGTESATNNLSGDDFTIDLASYATALTIDASALDAANKDNDADGDIDSSDSSAEKLVITGTASKALTVTGGSSDDTIIGSSDAAAGDTLKGGAGADTFTMGAGNLTYLDTIDGGAGTDTITAAQDVSDVDFMNVTNVETLTIDEAGTSTNTLGAYVNTSGLATVNLDPTHVSTIRANGTTGNINYVMKNNPAADDLAEDVQAGLGDDSLTVTGTAQLKADDTFDGGAGTDTIIINNSGAATIDAKLNLITNVEKILVKDNDGGDTVGAEDADVINITISGTGGGIATDNSTDNADVALEIDASIITDTNDTVTYTLSDINDKDYSFTVKDGAANASYTGSGVVDTVFGNGGDDSISSGGGDDVVDGGAGVDTITGGTGQDTLTGGAGKDIFKYALGSSETTVEKPDTITDFSSSNDTINISLTTAGSTYDFTNKGTATDASSSIEKLSSVKGQYLFNTTKNSLVLDTDGNGLLQASDYEVLLTGVTALADADITFDITTASGTADVITTGNGADTIVLAKADDAVTAGKGNDTVSLGNITYTGGAVIAGGEGTDTLAVTADADIKAYTTQVTGFEKITLASDKNITLSSATATLLNAATAPTVDGNASAANESFIVTTPTDATTLDISSITFGTDANAVLTGNDGIDVITASNGNDYLDGVALDDTHVGKAGNDTYNIGEVTGADKYVETSSNGTDTLILAVDGGDYTAQKYGTTAANAAVGSMANFEQIVLGDSVNATLLASNLAGNTIKIATLGNSANTITLSYPTGGTASTTDLSGITGANVTYTASTGLDSTTTNTFAGHAADTFVHDPHDGADTILLSSTTGIIDHIDIAPGDSDYNGFDVISNFAIDEDVLDMTLDGASGNTAGNATVNTSAAGSGIGSVKIASGVATFYTGTDGSTGPTTITTADLLTEVLGDIHAVAGLANTAKNFVFAVAAGGHTAGAGTMVVSGNATAADATYTFLPGVTSITGTHEITAGTGVIVIV